MLFLVLFFSYFWNSLSYMPSLQNNQNFQKSKHLNMAGFGKAIPKLEKAIIEPLPTDQCACGSNLKYADCCQKFHLDPKKLIDSPFKLIRARFSAYVYTKIPFLLESTHPESKDYCIEEEIIGSKRTKRTIWAKQLEARSMETDFKNLYFENELEDSQVNELGYASVSITLNRKPKSSTKFDSVRETILAKKNPDGGYLYISGKTDIITSENPQQKKLAIRQMN